MVVVGKLVKENCSSESKGRLGTIVRVSEIVLSKHSHWEEDVAHWKIHHANSDDDMPACHIVRPGKVASVRWQDKPDSLTIHVFYDDARGLSSYSYGSNSVEVV